jgi:hypothetical protein
MHDIKLVRLRSGEDIISTYKEDAETEMVQLKDPMVVMFKRLPTGASMMMISPWLPVELIENNTATIYTDDILTVVEPKEILINHYVRMVNDLNKYMDQDNEILEKHLRDMEEEMDEDDEYDEEEILEALKEKKNYKVH